MLFTALLSASFRHSPADPEHERGRSEEKRWARDYYDPIKAFENKYLGSGALTQVELQVVKEEVKEVVDEAVRYADNSPQPPADLARGLEYPTDIDTGYDLFDRPAFSDLVNKRTISPTKLNIINDHMAVLRKKAENGEISIAEAVNLAIHEEMLRDPTTTSKCTEVTIFLIYNIPVHNSTVALVQAEDLQAGSSYGIPGLTQQTYGSIRASDEIISEGHFIGKGWFYFFFVANDLNRKSLSNFFNHETAIGEAMNGYRPIVELMNTNFGIYGMAEIASCGNTYLQSGGQFKLPITILGAGGTSPDQALGAEHSQPFHAYIMGVPGLKIATAATPDAAYGITKSMIRDDGPCFLIFPVKLMKETKGTVDLGKCMPLKSTLIHKASEKSVANGNAVTVLTYLHGVKEAKLVIDQLNAMDLDIDLIDLRTLKLLDMETIKDSLERTHKLCILDESTRSGGVGATICSRVCEELFDLLDAPVVRLSMDDAPVPYASNMEREVVKRGADLVKAVANLCPPPPVF